MKLKLAHAHFPMHERRWGWYICPCGMYNYSTGIIANYNCVGVDPNPSLLQHIKKSYWNKWKNHLFEMKGDVGMA